nr:DUF2235 domain-containing protein [Roseateles koreensis]
MFFDGTGNNDEADTSTKRWSNIARIYRSARQLADVTGDPNVFPIYVPGVGTTFNGEAANWIDRKLQVFEDKVTGNAVGGGGDRRQDFAMDRVNDRLKQLLLDNAKTLGGDLKAYADQGHDKGFADLAQALAGRRLIKMINVSIFGFSRGASLARAFSNRLVNACKKNGDQLLYEGHPLTLKFMGLFDTVASFGVPAANVQLPWMERDLRVPPQVKRCVHYIAAHELRFSFPVDLIRRHGKLQDNWEETVYPGVHSDVGGGYEPIEQGAGNNYARIPMNDMISDARAEGVRLYASEEIKGFANALYKERFETLPATQAAYQAYMAQVSTKKGRVEDCVKAHMTLYYRAYGTMHRQHRVGPGDRDRQTSLAKRVLGSQGMAWEVAQYRGKTAISSVVLGGHTGVQYAISVNAETWRLQAWDQDANNAVVTFFDQFVHDSKAGFLNNAEPFSYFQPRGMAESSRSVSQVAGDWIHDASSTVEHAAVATAKKADDVVSAAEKKVSDTASTVAKKAESAYDSGKEKVIDTARSIEQKGSQAVAAGKQAVSSAMHSLEQGAKAAADAGGKAVDSGLNAVEQAWAASRAALGF